MFVLISSPSHLPLKANSIFVFLSLLLIDSFFDCCFDFHSLWFFLTCFHSNVTVFHISRVKFPFLHSFLTTFLSRTLEKNQQEHHVQFPEDCWMKWGVFRCSVCTDYVEGRCPVNFTLVSNPSSGADIKIHVWLKAEGKVQPHRTKNRLLNMSAEVFLSFFPLIDLMKNPKIEIEGANNHSKELIYPFTMKRETRVRLCTCD